MMLGGSALFGYTVDDHETIPAQLEALLRARGPAGVYNLGHTAYSTAGEEVPILVQELRAGRRPDVLIFYDGANEVGREPRGSVYENVQGPYVHGDFGWAWVQDQIQDGHRALNVRRLALWELAYRVHHLFERVTGQWDARLATERDKEGEFDRAAVERHAVAAARAYAVSMTVVKGIAQALKIRVVFVLQPLGTCVDAPRADTFPHFPGPRPWEVAYYTALYREIDMRMPDTLDWCRAMNADVAAGHRVFNTRLHLSAEGNRRIAERLLPLVLARGDDGTARVR
jgi:hypothetical protein